LVDEKDSGEDWIEVAETGDEEEASLIAGLLESEGIPVEVEPSGSHTFAESIPAMGTNRVTVPPDRAAEAREILAAQKARAAEEDGKDEESGEE
jgi:hypothetical protein